MHPFRIGKLRGGFCVTWYEMVDGTRTRRRYQLSAKTLTEAWPEGQRLYKSRLILRGGKLKFKTVWMEYQDELEGRRTAQHLKSMRKDVGPFFGQYEPLEIDDALVKRYVKAQRKKFKERNGREISNTTLYNEINHIQSTLNFAKRKKMINEDPHKLTKPARPNKVERWLDHNEIQALLDETQQTPHLHVATVLMLSTAGRIGAILDLTWDRVDFRKQTIDLRVKEKSHIKPRAFIPMNEGTAALLKQWKGVGYSGYVVEYKGQGVKSIQNAFKKAVQRAELSGKVTPHVMRHTSAVHMVASGCSMARVSQYLGHTSIAVTEKIYARYAPDHLREEAAAVDFLKGQKIEIKKPTGSPDD
ncbi:site-specific integrase [Roseibium sp. RKSG952]|uniref:tyrosine-type recombinase/integrase n=1 Tax=Roseibium sp. RKSG952 TaxID=2529384 RepID=UPI0012BD5A55|nr:site-specific integrase [Roseibium sp. RKSG952]MTI01658.1 site-specific integrase [Roseibium sp. RKSG952]